MSFQRIWLFSLGGGMSHGLQSTFLHMFKNNLKLFQFPFYLMLCLDTILCVLCGTAYTLLNGGEICLTHIHKSMSISYNML